MPEERKRIIEKWYEALQLHGYECIFDDAVGLSETHRAALSRSSMSDFGAPPCVRIARGASTILQLVAGCVSYVLIPPLLAPCASDSVQHTHRAIGLLGAL